MDARRTIFVTEGRDSLSIESIVSELEKKGKKENIELISKKTHEVGIQPITKFVNPVKANWWGIVAYF